MWITTMDTELEARVHASVPAVRFPCLSRSPLWSGVSSARIGVYRFASMQADRASCSALRCFFRHPGTILTSATIHPFKTWP